jgi:hypothetical protein
VVLAVIMLGALAFAAVLAFWPAAAPPALPPCPPNLPYCLKH